VFNPFFCPSSFLVSSQRIGEAYQILSDPQLRAAYDTRGKEAVDSAPKMDAGTAQQSTVQQMVDGGILLVLFIQPHSTPPPSLDPPCLCFLSSSPRSRIPPLFLLILLLLLLLPGSIYAMLFGSELFESIIGELQSATTVKVRQ
jgi:curved DNA-binding protein CbpA